MSRYSDEEPDVDEVGCPAIAATDRIEEVSEAMNRPDPDDELEGRLGGPTVSALIKALRIAVEALEAQTHAGSYVSQGYAKDALAAVRELVDLGEKP